MSITRALTWVVAGILVGCSEDLPALPVPDARLADGSTSVDARSVDASGVLDGAEPGCSRNGDCGEAQLCRFESSCGAQGLGTCVQRPPICTKELDRVCGCDGVTYSNPCAALASGASVWASGACGCQDLLGIYSAAVAVAKRCDPSTDRVHCQFRAPSNLLCGCPTSVEDAAEELEAFHTQLSNRYYSGSLGCPVPSCLPCPDAVEGQCESSETGGACVDQTRR